jgi:hypothetical protein
VYSRDQTDLDELLGTKYQYSIGFRHRRDNMLITFGFTENVQNVNNTPDVGLQLGFAWVPHRRSPGERRCAVARCRLDDRDDWLPPGLARFTRPMRH